MALLAGYPWGAQAAPCAVSPETETASLLPDSPGLSCFKRTGKRRLRTSNISPNRDIIRLPLQQYQGQQNHKPLVTSDIFGLEQIINAMESKVNMFLPFTSSHFSYNGAPLLANHSHHIQGKEKANWPTSLQLCEIAAAWKISGRGEFSRGTLGAPGTAAVLGTSAT